MVRKKQHDMTVWNELPKIQRSVPSRNILGKKLFREVTSEMPGVLQGGHCEMYENVNHVEFRQLFWHGKRMVR